MLRSTHGKAGRYMTDFGTDKNDRRERVFQMLYAADYNRDLTTEEQFASFFDEGECVPSTGYIHDTYFGVAEFTPESDSRIEIDSKNWKTSRMSGVVRTALRLAIYELLHTDIPPKVAINESIELVKKYGEEQEPPFVNGILNRIARNEGRL